MPRDDDPNSGFPSDLAVGSFVEEPGTSPEGHAGTGPFASNEATRYRRGPVLGEGGMGVVEEVFDRRLGRSVARKRCSASDGPYAERFAREVRITAQLDHPGIVCVHDAGLGADGRPHYTMRLVRGQTLRDALVLPAGDPTWLRGELDLLRHLRDAAEAVGFAHSRGIVHRDLKPSNLMVGPFGETQVMDWGLARPVPGPGGETWRHLLSNEVNTTAGTVLGTPQYMSPEQARGATVGPPADVWSLGIMLFEASVGARPFPGPSIPELLVQATGGVAVEPALAEARVPAPLRAIIERALQPEPRQRYADAKALADDLNRWLAGGRVDAHQYTTGEVVRNFLARFRVPVGAAAVALLLAVGGLVWLTWHARAEAERARVAEAEAAALQRDLWVDRALDAHRRHERAEAELLAAAALSVGESPDARGILMAHAVDPRPTLLVDRESPRCGRRWLSRRGRFFTCRIDEAIELWRTEPLERVWSVPAPTEAEAPVSDEGFVTIAPDEAAAVGTVIRDPAGRIVRRVHSVWTAVPPDGADGPVYSLNNRLTVADTVLRDLHPCGDAGQRHGDGMWVACAGRIVRWSPTNQVEAPTPIGSPELGYPRRLVATDHSVVLGTEVGVVMAHAWPSGEVMWSHRLDHAVQDLSISEDGSLVVAQPALGGAVVFDGQSGAVVARLSSVGATGEVALREDRELWVLGDTLQRHRIEVQPVRQFGHGVTGLAFSSDGSELWVTHGGGFDRVAWPSLERLSRVPLAHVAKDIVAHPDGGVRVAVAVDREGLSGLVDGDGRSSSLTQIRGYRRLARWGDEGVLALALAGQLYVVRDHLEDEFVALIDGGYDLEGTASGDRAVVVDAAGLLLLAHPSAVPTRLLERRGLRVAHWPDRGERLFAAGRGVAFSIDSRSGGEIWGYEAEHFLPRQLRASPDARWVAVGDDTGRVHVLEAATGRLAAVLHGHREQVPALAFTPDSRTLVSGSWDDSIQAWDLTVLDADPAALTSRIETAWGGDVDALLE